MAFVKTFVVKNASGIPDAYIRAFLTDCEKDGPIHVQTALVRTDTALLLTVIATQQDTWESLGVVSPRPSVKIPEPMGDGSGR